ncbi:hypothetical protein Ciccas_004101, partial [Cichlidogyrus casuarinus]
MVGCIDRCVTADLLASLSPLVGLSTSMSFQRRFEQPLPRPSVISPYIKHMCSLFEKPVISSSFVGVEIRSNVISPAADLYDFTRSDSDEFPLLCAYQDSRGLSMQQKILSKSASHISVLEGENSSWFMRKNDRYLAQQKRNYGHPVMMHPDCSEFVKKPKYNQPMIRSQDCLHWRSKEKELPRAQATGELVKRFRSINDVPRLSTNEIERVSKQQQREETLVSSSNGQIQFRRHIRQVDQEGVIQQGITQRLINHFTNL